MATKNFANRSVGWLLAAGLSLLTASNAGADEALTLVPEQEGPSACAAGMTPTERAECERWYYMTEKRRPDAWNDDHPAFSKKQRWYHVGKAEAPPSPRIIVLEGVRFEFDKAVIRPESFPVLERNLPELQAGSVGVKVVGHTDSRGTDDYNQDLSERRARAVKDYYVQRGIPADRLEVEGRGESEPIAVNEPVDEGGDTEAEHEHADPGRAKNRRIELHIQDVMAAVLP